MDEMIGGTIKVGWQISAFGLGIDRLKRDLTKAELTALYDRIEDLVTQAFHQRVSIWIDGESRPPVDVFLETDGMEIEIDDGPVNGMLSDLRIELESEEE